MEFHICVNTGYKNHGGVHSPRNCPVKILLQKYCKILKKQIIY